MVWATAFLCEQGQNWGPKIVFKKQKKEIRSLPKSFQKSSGLLLRVLVHRIAAFAFAMAIPRCQWRHRCVVTLGKFLVVLYSKPLWRKEKWKQRRKGDVRDVKRLSRAMLKNREGHHSDGAVKKGVWIAMWRNCVVHRCVPRCSVVVH